MAPPRIPAGTSLLERVVQRRITLPWGHTISTPEVKDDSGVSFDPLGVLAILPNPRADASASRLYSQPDRHVFRWPHTMQIGAILVPVHVFVNHLTRNYKSIHPAVDMFLANIDTLNVRSTIGRTIDLFPTLRVMTSDSTLIDPLNFKPSANPTNDILIVRLSDPAIPGAPGEKQDSPGLPTTTRWAMAAVLFLTEVLMGLSIACGLVFSVLFGDMWAVALFATYVLHWSASTIISFSDMIVPDPTLNILPDETIVYAIFERPSGGLIVFKGCQDVMERWARTTWIFNATLWHKAIHWAWVISGTAAALASIICMVNMNGYLQLVFLGILVYSSVAELWLTALSRQLQPSWLSSVGACSTSETKRNNKRYKSIIQASLQEKSEFRLDGLDWISLGILPQRDVFEALMITMRYLNGLDGDYKALSGTTPTIEEAEVKFLDACKGLSATDIGGRETRDGILAEIRKVWTTRRDSAPPKASESP